MDHKWRYYHLMNTNFILNCSRLYLAVSSTGYSSCVRLKTFRSALIASPRSALLYPNVVKCKSDAFYFSQYNHIQIVNGFICKHNFWSVQPGSTFVSRGYSLLIGHGGTTGWWTLGFATFFLGPSQRMRIEEDKVGFSWHLPLRIAESSWYFIWVE